MALALPLSADVPRTWAMVAGGLMLGNLPMGVMMMIFFLAWIRLATLLFALFFGFDAQPGNAIHYAGNHQEGGMLAVGSSRWCAGFWCFRDQVVAIPLMDQDLTFMEGIEAAYAV